MTFSPQTKQQIADAFIVNAKFLMNEAGISQKDLAKKIGTTPSEVSRCLAGRRLGLDGMLSIANGLEVSLPDLLNSDSEIFKKAKESKRARLLAELAELDGEK